eukprot:TRINITY_DN787_c0_g1_i1.p1 TRINITY_DN787_c0_g1~~TRINITY_DN787_c0_g1_i1.p1  ORF type:complete len:393 (-),score=78.25 TRINITY_DN787_c0_g1_i1:102-1280(-)
MDRGRVVDKHHGGMDWIKAAVIQSDIHQQQYHHNQEKIPIPDTHCLEIQYKPQNNEFVFCIVEREEIEDLDSFHNQNMEYSHMIVTLFRERGYIRVSLSEDIKGYVSTLEEVSQRCLFKKDTTIKKGLNNRFRKKKMLGNVFSYALRNGPGKDTFKIRGMGEHCNDSVISEGFTEEEVHDLLDAAYSVCTSLHEIGYLVLLAIVTALEEVKDYLLSKIEMPWGYESTEEAPFGMSYMNLLNYFDPEKPVPVDPHTDYVLMTVLPLNSKAEALEVWDFKEEKWIQLEHPEEECFDSAVVLIGDTFSRLTNDYFVSTVHRVVSATVNNRFSCPYFISTKYDAILDYSDHIGPDSIFGEPEDPLPPIKTVDFMWERIRSDNYTEVSIMEKYKSRT